MALSRDPSTIPLPAACTPQNTLLQSVDLKSDSSISAAFDAAIATFGRVDVVVNNAGYGMVGELESVNIDRDGKELMDINFWAPVYITRHAIRVMREINPKTGPIGGVIAQVSSIGGYIAAPGQGTYHASKWALEGFTESVAKEVDPAWAIRWVIFEPGSVKTRWSGENQKKGVVQHEAYKGKDLALDKIKGMRGAFEDKIGANSDDVAKLMVKVVVDEDHKWGGKELLRLPVGADAWALESSDVGEVRASLDKWREISESTSPGDVKETLRSIGMLKD